MKIMPHEMPNRTQQKQSRRTRPELHTDEFLADCAELSIDRVAQKWKCNRSTVMARRKELSARGVKLRRAINQTPQKKINAIVTMRNAGVKFKDIADKLNMPRSSVANIYYREAPYFSV